MRCRESGHRARSRDASYSHNVRIWCFLLLFFEPPELAGLLVTLFESENERQKIEPVPIPLPRASFSINGHTWDVTID